MKVTYTISGNRLTIKDLDQFVARLVQAGVNPDTPVKGTMGTDQRDGDYYDIEVVVEHEESDL